MIMTEEMKKHPKSNITLVIPGFAEDEEFFQNSSLLLSLLEEKFNVSSVSTIRDLLADYHSMTYKPNEDPTPFIVKLQSSIKMINQLCGNTFQEDELRMGFQLLSKLANGPEEVSSLFNEVEKVTFSAVARSLCDWWDSLQRKADLDKNKAAKLSHHQSPITTSNFKAPKPIFVKDLLGFLGTFVDQLTGNFNSVRHQTKLNSTNSVWKFTQTQTGPVNLPIAKAQVGGFCS